MSYKDFGTGEHLDEWSGKMRDIMDEMRNRSFVDFRDAGPWKPATNLYESESTIVVCVELSGVDDWEIDLESDPAPRLRVSGVRHQPKPLNAPELLSIHLLEIDEGPFCRELDFPCPIDVDDVDANFSKGYVWIIIPKAKSI
jgi:HSP20 family protein